MQGSCAFLARYAGKIAFLELPMGSCAFLARYAGKIAFLELPMQPSAGVERADREDCWLNCIFCTCIFATSYVTL